MAKNPNIKTALRDASCVRTVWESIPDFKMGSVSLDDFIALRDAAEFAAKEYAKKDVELTGLKGNRDDQAQHLSALITRFRSGMRSMYGPDSTQYGQAGGTRARDRKPQKPRAKSAAV